MRPGVQPGGAGVVRAGGGPRERTSAPGGARPALGQRRLPGPRPARSPRRRHPPPRRGPQGRGRGTGEAGTGRDVIAARAPRSAPDRLGGQGTRPLLVGACRATRETGPDGVGGRPDGGRAWSRSGARGGSEGTRAGRRARVDLAGGTRRDRGHAQVLDGWGGPAGGSGMRRLVWALGAAMGRSHTTKFPARSPAPAL